ncbi:hypothetical protein VPHD484_0312 [Vibrio phage D484]
MRTSLTDTLVEITALSCWNRCCRSDEIQYLHESMFDHCFTHVSDCFVV